MKPQDIGVNHEYLTRLTNFMFVFLLVFPLFISGRTLLLSNFFNGSKVLSSVAIVYLFIVYLFTLWLFYSEPKYLLKNNNFERMSRSEPKYAWMRQWLDKEGLSSVKLLLSPEKQINAYAFGTIHHQYISVSQFAVDSLQPNELKFLVLHEACHHKYGDAWKFPLARYLVIIFFIGQLLFEIMGLIINPYMKGTSLTSESIMRFPATMSLFLNILSMLGILLLARFRELLADNYAFQQFNDVNLFALMCGKIGFKKAENRKLRSLIFPQMHFHPLLNFHPSGNKRLKSLQNPNLIINEIYSLVIFLGLFLGAYLGNSGDIDRQILLCLPTICILGTIFFLYIFSCFHIIKKLAIILIFTHTISLSSFLFTLVWSIGLAYSPEINVNIYYYFFSPTARVISDYVLLVDNFFITVTLGSLYIFSVVKFLVFINTFVKTHHKKKQILTGPMWFTWAFLSVVIFFFWLFMFGIYPIQLFFSGGYI